MDQKQWCSWWPAVTMYGVPGQSVCVNIYNVIRRYLAFETDRHRRDEFVLYADFQRENSALKKKLNAVEMARTGKLDMDNETRDWLLHDYGGNKSQTHVYSRPVSITYV